MTTALFTLNFLYSFLATVAGGGFLALLYFWLREKFFPLPRVTGRWYFEIRTVNTTYNPYKGMVLRYIAMLWLEGNCIKGTVEKIYENSSTGERNYVGKNRTRGVVDGFVKKTISQRTESCFTSLRMATVESQQISTILLFCPATR